MKTTDITVLDSDLDRAKRVVAALAASDLHAHVRELEAMDAAGHLGEAAHCFLVAITAPIGRSLEAVRRLAESGGPVTVVAYGPHPTIEGVVALMRAGAFDVVTRLEDGHALAASLRNALARDAKVAGTRGRVRAAKAKIKNLSKREREVLSCVLAGYSNKGMGDSLGVSVKTIEAHRANLMRKADCRSVSAIVQLAIDAGFDQAPPPLAALEPVDAA
jgi:FixJ family two-component response regulator